MEKKEKMGTAGEMLEAEVRQKGNIIVAFAGGCEHVLLLFHKSCGLIWQLWNMPDEYLWAAFGWENCILIDNTLSWGTVTTDSEPVYVS